MLRTACTAFMTGHPGRFPGPGGLSSVGYVPCHAPFLASLPICLPPFFTVSCLLFQPRGLLPCTTADGISPCLSIHPVSRENTGDDESWGDGLGIRQVVVAVEVAVQVDIPSIEVAVVHMETAERAGPQVRTVPGINPGAAASPILVAIQR